MMNQHRFMDSYPNERQDQMPWMGYPHPGFGGFGAAQPHMKMDAPRPPFVYDSWPYTHPGSVPFNGGCCSHNNFSGYYNFTPPCPHVSSMTACQHCGNYSPYREPVHYMPTPPTHYPVEIPMYDYDKAATWNSHCCGCPSHIHGQRNDRVKIEEQEQEPEVEGKVNNSLVPVQSKNHPYPILWMPPEYWSKEQQKPNNFGTENASDTRIPTRLKSREQGPRVMNGWYPFDMNSLQSWLQDQNGKKSTKQQAEDERRLVPGQQPKAWNGWFPFGMNGTKMPEIEEKNSRDSHSEDKMSQWPFPIFWMPTANKQEDDEKRDNSATEAASKADEQIPSSNCKAKDEERKENQDQGNVGDMSQFPFPIFWMPSSNQREDVEKRENKESKAATKSSEEIPNFRFIPVNLPGYGDDRNKLKADEEKHGSQAGAEAAKEKKNNHCDAMKPSEVRTLKDQSEDTETRGRDASAKHEEKKGTKTQRQSSSPTMASKLPPVCLRLDPLPKKKNGNGSSRSPSPPGAKKAVGETEKPASDDTAKHVQEVKPVKKETKNIKVVDARSINKDGVLEHRQVAKSVPIVPPEDTTRESATEMKEKSNDQCREGGAEHASEMAADERTMTKEATDVPASPESECNTKKKLSDAEAAVLIQSAYRGFDVRRYESLKKLKEMAKVRVQTAEVKTRIQALESSSDLINDDRQRVVIGEMIMNLLLKLDTIQGLHPSLREIRKGLAKELVSLQEQLDALMSRKSKDSTEEALTDAAAVDRTVETECVTGIQNTELAGSCGYQRDMEEKKQDHNGLVGATVAVSRPEDVGVKDAEPDDDEKCRIHQNEKNAGPSLGEIKSQPAEQDTIAGSSDDAGHGGSDDSQQAVTPIAEEFEVPSRSEQSVQETILEGRIEPLDKADEVNVKYALEDQESKEPKELQLPISGEESSVCEAKGNQESQSELAENLIEEARSGESVVNDSEGLADLPVQVIDEENDIEKHKPSILPEENEGKSNISADILYQPEKHELGGEESGICELAENLTPDAKNESLSTNNNDAGVNLLAELPVAVIDEEKPVEKHEHSIVPQNDEAEKNITADISQFEKHEFSGLPHNDEEESDMSADMLSRKGPFVDQPEIEYHSRADRDLPGDNTVEMDAEKQLETEVVDNDKKEPEATEETRLISPANLAVENEAGKDNTCPLPEPQYGVSAQENILQSEEEEKQTIKQRLESSGKEVEDDTHPSSANEELAVQGELETLPSSPSASQISYDEHDTWSEKDKRLIQENEKLREMINKLVMAGSQQLDAISSLTDRVKGLEKKLSKKKKLKIRHNRRPPSASAQAK